MSSSGDRKAAIKKLKKLMFTPKIEVKAFRETMDTTFGNVFLPNDVDYSVVDYAGVSCDVLNPVVYSSGRVLLYIHGGCFIGGSKKAYRPFVASLAHTIFCRAVVPDFKLAPTFQFPASLDDIQAVFRALYTEEVVACSLDNYNRSQKKDPEIVIMADGSGASLALALVLSLRGQYRNSVKKIILISPWLDISQNAYCFSKKKASDELITSECIKRAAELYTHKDNRENPLVSPLKVKKEQIENFPEVFIQMGEKELLLKDAQDFKKILEEAGNKCELDIWKNMMSMFQMADEYLAESHLAVEKIGKILVGRTVTEEDSVKGIQLELEKSSNNI